MVDPSSSVALSQVTASGVAVMLIQFLKKAMPDMPDQVSGKIYATIGAIASLGTALGLHLTYVASSGDLTIHGLTAANLMWGAAHWTRSFLFQEGEYRIYKVSKYLPMVYKAIQTMQSAGPAIPLTPLPQGMPPAGANPVPIPPAAKP